MRDTHRERGRDIGRGREKPAPCRELDAGLDSRAPGPCPGQKAGAQPLSHPGVPITITLNGRKYRISLSPQNDTNFVKTPPNFP